MDRKVVEVSSLSLSFSDYLPTYLPTYLSIYLSTYLSIYLSIYLYGTTSAQCSNASRVTRKQTNETLRTTQRPLNLNSSVHGPVDFFF